MIMALYSVAVYKWTHLSVIQIGFIELYIFEGAARIVGWRLKEEGTYFKVKEIIHIKFESFVIFSFWMAINKDWHDI